jgi:hypothetical protein
VKRFRWRRRWMGPKHGVPRGTAVFRSAGSNETDLPPLFQLSCERLKSWSRDDSLTLDDSPESLSLLDKRLDDWNVDPTHYDKVDLSNEVGAYLGTVIVKHVDGAHWKMWPNGHPVVQLPSGKSLDVTSMANDRLHHAGPSLDAIYSNVQSS